MARSLKEIEQQGVDGNEVETMRVKVFFDGIQEMAKAFPEFKSVMQSIRESQSFSPKRKKQEINSEERKKSDKSKRKTSVIAYLNS